MKFKTLVLTGALLTPFSVHASVLVNAKHVVERTIRGSLDAQSLVQEEVKAKENVRTSKSQYDTYLSGSFSYQKDKSERQAAVFGTETTETVYSFGVGQLFPSGTEASLQLLSTKSTSDSPFANNSKLFDSRTVFSVSQPLLFNYFGYQNRQQVAAAKKAVQATSFDVQSKLMQLSMQNLGYYWNWYLQNRLKAINENALSAARRLYRTNRQKMVIGLIEESDIYAFAANVDLKQAELLNTEANLAESEIQLRVALNYPDETLSSSRESMKRIDLGSVDQMISKALDTHPEYLSMKKALEAQNIQVAINKNSKLPTVDFQGSLTLNGVDPTFGTATSDIGNGNPIWSTGVSVAFPLQNRAARAQYNSSNAQKKQYLYELKNLENKIVSQIREGYKKYQKQLRRMKVVATAVNHQKLKWEGEISKYDQGRSDPDLVIRYQDDYLNTQMLYAQAQVEYQLAVSQLNYYRAVLGMELFK